jgi:glutamine amidotransferase/cyclase
MLVSIVPTGAGNLASLRAAIGRAGGRVAIVEDAEAIRNAERVILPGVGAFREAAIRLRSAGADEALRERIRRDRPTLCICLGMQLLFDESEECGGAGSVAGLGVMRGAVRRFSSTDEAGRRLRVPHLGWSPVAADPDAPPDRRWRWSGWCAFAHSFRIDAPTAARGLADASIGWSRYGERFVAGFERGALMATQFHPELSGCVGAAIVEDFIAPRSRPRREIVLCEAEN